MKILAVAGTKNTGKTTLVTLLVSELVHRGFRVGTVKHTHVKLDVEGKDTWKHREAGAQVVVGAGGDETFYILDHDQHLDQIIESIDCLLELDFLILEGYKPTNYAKIFTSPLKDPFSISQVDVRELDEKAVKKLANLVEERSFSKLTNMNCKECGFESCQEMAQAVIKGEVREDLCVMKQPSDITLTINKKKIPLNPFVKKFVKNTILGMLSSLKIGDQEKLGKIELMIEDEGNR